MYPIIPAIPLASVSNLLVFTLATLLVACGTVRTASPDTPPATLPAPAPAPTPVEPAAPAPTPRLNLAAEQVRLTDLFRGTPVVFAMQQDGSLRATVPLRFSFGAGAFKVKPPLAAVLDRLAKSQAPTHSKLRVSAPADPGARAASTLAQNRVASLRDHLIAQGIAAARIQIGTKPPTDRVEIVVSDTAR